MHGPGIELNIEIEADEELRDGQKQGCACANVRRDETSVNVPRGSDARGTDSHGWAQTQGSATDFVSQLEPKALGVVTYLWFALVVRTQVDEADDSAV